MLDDLKKRNIAIDLRRDEMVNEINNAANLPNGMNTETVTESLSPSSTNKSIGSFTCDLDPHIRNEENPIGVDVQLSVMKAKVRMLRTQLSQIKKSKVESDDVVKNLEAKLKQVLSENARLEKRLILMSKSSDNAFLLKGKCEELEAENNSLRKEVQESQKCLQEAQTCHSKKEDKLNQALREIDLLKKRIIDHQPSKTDSDSADKKERNNFLATIANLEKQNGELFTVVKKQMKLIDIMKRQKVHLEASRLLSFTEAEFSKILDWDAKAYTP
jgi:chromosome segregation ATPase